MPWLARIYRNREQDQDPNKIRSNRRVDNCEFQGGSDTGNAFGTCRTRTKLPEIRTPMTSNR